VVGRLVEHQQVGTSRHQQRQVGPGALPRREGAHSTQHVVGAETELRQQGPRLGLVLTGRRTERADQRLLGVEGAAHLVDLTHHDGPAEPRPAGRQRQPAEQRAEQRRLARAVGAGQRDAVAAVHGEVDRPQPEVVALDDRGRQPGHVVRATGRRVQRQP